MIRTTLAALLLALGPFALAGQGPPGSVRVAIGFGVDTLRSPDREIFQRWRTYLLSHPESLRSSPLWSAADQARGPAFDLLRSYVYQGFTHFTVVHLAPAPGLDSTYLIRTLVSGVYDSSDVKPLALFRVYATREQGRWVLENALLIRTRTWSRTTIGSVTFLYPPGHPLQVGEARRTATFVDSLARGLGLPAPGPITYYFTDNLTDLFAAMGLDYFPLGPDTAGGRSTANMVFVGSSTHGERWRHELAHIVLASLTGPRTARLVVEGLATWTGGSAGLDYGELLPGLRRYLQAHPDLSLEAVMRDPPQREGTLDVGYDGFAVLCDMIFQRGGVAAIRQLAETGTDPKDVLATAARLLNVQRPELDAAWRQRVLGTR
jgi:hypothetical protein